MLLRSGLSLRHMRMMVALDDHGRVSAAAQVMNISQPAASRIIAEMEAALDVKLLERLPRGVALIHEPVEGEHLGARLPARESRELTKALAGLVTRLHEANVCGISLRVGVLRQSEGRIRLDGFEHLHGAGTTEQDVEGLASLLQRVAAEHLDGVLEPPPRTAAELLQSNPQGRAVGQP